LLKAYSYKAQTNTHMYRIEQHSDIIRLIGPGGTVAEIIPSGALLNRFSVIVGGKELNVIDGFEHPSRVKADIKPAFQSAKLSPFVCRIQDAHYSYKGKEYTLGKFTMNGSAIHGLVFDETFEVAASEAGPEQAMVELRYAYPSSDAGYPFPFECLVRYTLKGSSIRLDTEILNTGKDSMPLADGWHPYFQLGKPIDELELHFHAHQMLEFKNLIPTGVELPNRQFTHMEKIGATELDNSFVLDSPTPSPACILRDPDAKVQIEISPEGSYPILQIYTPPHRRSIAIENLSGAPDNFNNGIGLLELASGSVAAFSTTYTIRSI
jgi:aldose 1-epimerase